MKKTAKALMINGISESDIDSDLLALKQALATLPSLYWGGFWSERFPNGMSLAKARAQTIDPAIGLSQFKRAKAFLAITPRNRHISYEHSTYLWKHRAEDYAKRVSPGEDPYVGEGAFIAALIAAGMPVKTTPRGTFTDLCWRRGRFGG